MKQLKFKVYNEIMKTGAQSNTKSKAKDVNDVITLQRATRKKQIMASKKQRISKNQKSIGSSRRCYRVGEQARAKRTETGLKISS